MGPTYYTLAPPLSHLSLFLSLLGRHRCEHRLSGVGGRRARQRAGLGSGRRCGTRRRDIGCHSRSRGGGREGLKGVGGVEVVVVRVKPRRRQCHDASIDGERQ